MLNKMGDFHTCRGFIYFLAGILLSFLLFLIAVILEIARHSLPITVASFFHLQPLHPSYWLLGFVLILLSILAGLYGVREDRLNILKTALETEMKSLVRPIESRISPQEYKLSTAIALIISPFFVPKCFIQNIIA